MKKLLVSIIVVHYKAKKELFDCLSSIKSLQLNLPYEVIVVDNDEKKSIEKELKTKFNWVKYIKSPGNIGFSAGNNLGVKYAKGEFLFFLNPDTKVLKGSIGKLLKFLLKNKNAAIVAPLLLDNNSRPYPLQGTLELTPLRGIIALSFINRLVPDNPVSRKFWLMDWDKKNAREVDVVPGTAFLINRQIFERIGGFDKRFFLFFEENDFCKRAKKLGYKIYINSTSRILHFWGLSTKHGKSIDRVFSQSRFLYFKKHFGLLPAFFVHLILNLNKTHLFLTAILMLGGFLRFFHLGELMMFIGDQGWFYLSAKEMVITGQIPLVGITASHTWLHQGPLWTYILALIFGIFRFNPIAPSYFTALLGVISVFLTYKAGSLFFSKRVGLIAAVLYATSPLVIISDRMPYHTSPISFFTIVFFLCLYKWLKGNIDFFPLTILFLAILYNFELATQVLWFVLFAFLIFGFWQKKIWARVIFQKNILALSFLALFIPLLPILIYDIGQGFPQTIKFGAWILYRIISFSLTNTFEMFFYFISFIKRLIFIPTGFVALFIFLLSFIFFLLDVFKNRSLKNSHPSKIILLLGLGIPFLGFFANRTASQAYLPLLFPLSIILVSYFFDFLWQKIKPKTIPFIFISIIVISNIFYLTSWDFFIEPGFTFAKRLEAARMIIQKAEGKEYNLKGLGRGSEFKSFTANYEYLTWWLGQAPSEKKTSLTVLVSEEPGGIKVEKEEL